jgi:hypothetical protein
MSLQIYFYGAPRGTKILVGGTDARSRRHDLFKKRVNFIFIYNAHISRVTMILYLGISSRMLLMDETTKDTIQKDRLLVSPMLVTKNDQAYRHWYFKYWGEAPS